MSIKCFVLRCLSCFRMSIVKSPHKNIVLLWGLFSKMRSTFSQNVSILDPGLRSIQLTIIFFLFGMANSTVTHSKIPSTVKDLLIHFEHVMSLWTYKATPPPLASSLHT